MGRSESDSKEGGSGVSWVCVLGVVGLVIGILLLTRPAEEPLVQAEWYETMKKKVSAALPKKPKPAKDVAKKPAVAVVPKPTVAVPAGKPTPTTAPKQQQPQQQQKQQPYKTIKVKGMGAVKVASQQLPFPAGGGGIVGAGKTQWKQVNKA